jgi:hypothetical protein
MQVDAGSDAITAVIEHTQPSFAFFGHYHERTPPEGWRLGRTEVYHLRALEFHGRGHCAEELVLGVLRWAAGRARFEYAPAEWLRTFTRDNWETR